MAISREKIALVVFSVLILLGLGSLIGYLAIGHSWNVAATNIDDATGSMEGYTTILFKGTVPELSPGKDDTDKEEFLEEKESSTTGNSKQKEETDQTLKSEEGIASANSQQDKTGTTDTEAENDANAGFSKNTTDAEDASSPNALLGLQGADSATPNNEGTAENNTTTTKKPALLLRDVEESYQEKNATVLSLDVENLERYIEGAIFKKDGHRFGVFSVAETDMLFRIKQKVKYFEKHEVDFLIVLTPDKELLEGISNIDIVVSTQDEGLFVAGETINNTFYVSTPTVGSVGAILISPSNVVSAKVISEL